MADVFKSTLVSLMSGMLKNYYFEKKVPSHFINALILLIKKNLIKSCIIQLLERYAENTLQPSLVTRNLLAIVFAHLSARQRASSRRLERYHLAKRVRPIKLKLFKFGNYINNRILACKMYVDIMMLTNPKIESFFFL